MYSLSQVVCSEFLSKFSIIISMGYDKKNLLLKKLGFLDKNRAKATAENFRCDGKIEKRLDSNLVSIATTKEGIEVQVAKGAKNEVIDLPVLMLENNLKEKIVTKIIVGEGAKVLIISGCGVCNFGDDFAIHEGVHKLEIKKNAEIEYIERHYATGAGKKEINTYTEIIAKENSRVVIKTVQIDGVDKSERNMKITLGKGAKTIIEERIKTTKKQIAKTSFYAQIDSLDASLKISSRSVATDDSFQSFKSEIIGENKCFAHVECDAILVKNGRVIANPMVDAKHNRAELIHEAQIGKIAEEQLLKLLTLGYSKSQAESIILEGFLNG